MDSSSSFWMVFLILAMAPGTFISGFANIKATWPCGVERDLGILLYPEPVRQKLLSHWESLWSPLKFAMWRSGQETVRLGTANQRAKCLQVLGKACCWIHHPLVFRFILSLYKIQFETFWPSIPNRRDFGRWESFLSCVSISLTCIWKSQGIVASLKLLLYDFDES